LSRPLSPERNSRSIWSPGRHGRIRAGRPDSPHSGLEFCGIQVLETFAAGLIPLDHVLGFVIPDVFRQLLSSGRGGQDPLEDAPSLVVFGFPFPDQGSAAGGVAVMAALSEPFSPGLTLGKVAVRLVACTPVKASIVNVVIAWLAVLP
jgi:hypothetical protein